MKKIESIESFRVDHDKILPGIYVSRIDGDIMTLDLRTRKPNNGEYMDSTTMHTVEHMFATLVRNSEIGDRVIYFGPMGCRTGFYLLLRNTDIEEAVFYIKKVLSDIVAYEGEVFGATRKECGNYLDLDLESAKKECKQYLSDLEKYNRTDGKYDD
jgi:S-ribosylhomocysteine lyase